MNITQLKKILFFIIILVIIECISIIYFHIMNPFLSGFGFSQIIFTDKQYVVVQNYPQKVVFSKQFSPESKKTGKEIFEEYMKKEGFELGEQLGTEFTFYKENKKETIYWYAHGLFNIWEWK